MRTNLFLSVSAITLILASCSPTVPGELNTIIKQSPTSTVIEDTFNSTATVTAIDSSARKLSVTYENGKRSTLTCGPEVVNFHQILVNDRIKVRIREQTAVYLDKGKPLAAATEASHVTYSAMGAKPGVATSAVIGATVRISAMDTGARKLTLQTIDGALETIKVGDQIDFSKLNVGDSVSIRKTEEVTMFVDHP